MPRSSSSARKSLTRVGSPRKAWTTRSWFPSARSNCLSLEQQVNALRREPSSRLRHQWEAIRAQEGGSLLAVAADDRWHERKAAIVAESMAQPFVTHDARRRSVAAQQMAGEIGPPVTQAGKEHDVVVAARNDQVGALASDDLEQPPLEARRILQRRRHEVNAIEVEQRRFVRDARRADELEALAAALEGGQDLLPDDGSRRDEQQTQLRRHRRARRRAVRRRARTRVRPANGANAGTPSF